MQKLLFTFDSEAVYPKISPISRGHFSTQTTTNFCSAWAISSCSILQTFLALQGSRYHIVFLQMRKTVDFMSLTVKTDELLCLIQRLGCLLLFSKNLANVFLLFITVLIEVSNGLYSILPCCKYRLPGDNCLVIAIFV